MNCNIFIIFVYLKDKMNISEPAETAESIWASARQLGACRPVPSPLNQNETEEKKRQCKERESRLLEMFK